MSVGKGNLRMVIYPDSNQEAVNVMQQVSSQLPKST